MTATGRSLAFSERLPMLRHVLDLEPPQMRGEALAALASRLMETQEAAEAQRIAEEAGTAARGTRDAAALAVVVAMGMFALVTSVRVRKMYAAVTPARYK